MGSAPPKMSIGTVAGVTGSVVDVAIGGGAGLPPINHALIIEAERLPPIVLEVQQHLNPATVRCVAMSETAGLACGDPVADGGGPIEMPVGEPMLGRLADVTGRMIDDGAALPDDLARWPIHRRPPPLVDQSGQREVLHTGIKVIDLLAPLARGG